MSQCRGCERPAEYGEPLCGVCVTEERHGRVCDGEIVAVVDRVTAYGPSYAWRCTTPGCGFYLPAASPNARERAAADRAFVAAGQ
jgi:hypothetical protein